MSQAKAAPVVIRTQRNRPLTPIERAVVESGRSVNWYARKLSERGVSKRTLANFETTLRRYMRNGSAPFHLAARFVRLLDLPLESPIHDLLLKPKQCWPTWALQGATGTPGKSVSVASRASSAQNRARIAARPVHQNPVHQKLVHPKPVRLEPKRMVVLEVL